MDNMKASISLEIWTKFALELIRRYKETALDSITVQLKYSTFSQKE